MKPVGIFVLFVAMSALWFQAQEEPGPEASAFLQRVASLEREGKLEEALKLLDGGLAKYNNPDYDRFFTLNFKYLILVKLNRLSEAATVAAEKAGIIKSPKQARLAAEAYLKTDDPETALDWLEQSVDRGLQTYEIFDNSIYDPLRGNARFAGLVDQVKKNNGIGLPAKPFVRRNLSADEVSLHRLKGKVVLLDFWATWCPPCLEQMPHLQQCYKTYKDKGFEIIGFSGDRDLNRLTGYLKKAGIGWDIVQCPQGQDDETMVLYKIANIPASFLIDKSGVVRHVNLTGKKLEEAIASLLEE